MRPAFVRFPFNLILKQNLDVSTLKLRQNGRRHFKGGFPTRRSEISSSLEEKTSSMACETPNVAPWLKKCPFCIILINFGLNAGRMRGVLIRGRKCSFSASKFNGARQCRKWLTWTFCVVFLRQMGLRVVIRL